MKAKIERITPAIAMEILEKHNPRNRSISERTVQSYAMDMKENRWTLTHQGIALDENGDLLDGQHRLWAVVFSGVPTEFWVFRGAPVKKDMNGVEIYTMDAIDRGRVRTTGQQMQLCHGIKNGNVVAAALRHIGRMVYPNQGSNRLSTANSLFFYDIYGKDVEHIISIITVPRFRVAWCLAPLSVYHHGEHDKASAIAMQLQTLEGLTSPVRAMLKHLDLHGGKKTMDPLMRTWCNAILHFHEGNEVKRLQDVPVGVQFINGMFPSITKKIREAMTPLRTNIKTARKLNQ
jgi:hypothetical protein